MPSRTLFRERPGIPTLARVASLVGLTGLLALPSPAAAQPKLTAVSNWNADASGNYVFGATSTIPGVNWQTFISTDNFATFLSNPLSGIQLAVGTNTFSFASNTYGAAYLGINLFFDAAASPALSGVTPQGVVGGMTGDAGATSWNPYTLGFGPAPGLSYTAGGYTVTLTRWEFATSAADLVGMGSAAPDGWPDYNGQFDITVGAITATPEPSSVVLLGSGLALLAGVARRRRSSSPRS